MARVALFLLLISHLIIRVAFQLPLIFTELFIFNAIALLSAFVAWGSPSVNDKLAKRSIALGILIWAAGSTLSTSNSFYTFQFPGQIITLCYIAFYPLIFLGVIRSLAVTKKIAALEILETAIIALGFTSVIASLLLRPASLRFSGSSFEIFTALAYPIGDFILVAASLSLIVLQYRNRRALILFGGICTFAITDLYFLLRSASETFEFAALTDDGWLLGLALIATSLWHYGGESEIKERAFDSWAITISLLLSTLILTVGALRPKYFPTFVLILAFLTIALAFIRMALALRDAREISADREQARTDELTGIPNRRQFIAELELLRRKTGTLLLLDLDGFKAVNDKHGHGVGDELLKQITIRFQRVLPDEILLARLGGDEFGVIIYGEKNIGNDIALALRATCTYPYTLSVGELRVGVSIGSVTTEGPTMSKEELLKRADSAMYEAKRSGSGLVQSKLA